MARYRVLQNISDSDESGQEDTKFNKSPSLLENVKLSSSDDEGGKGSFKLQRTIGVFTGINIVVGSMIGSGIFIVPTGVLKHCMGNVPLSIGVWVIGGLITIGVALCLCELATMIPHSGGCAAYFKEIYGDWLCFVYLWMLLFSAQPQGAAVQVIALGEYVSKAIQSATGQCNEDHPILLPKLIGSVICLLVLLCNILNVKLAGKLQDFCTVGKVCALVIICVAGLIMVAMDATILKENFLGSNVKEITKAVLANTSASTTSIIHVQQVGFTDFSLGVFQALWAYDGFDNITFVTEEVKKPKKTLPLIIIPSVFFVMTLYIFVNISYFAVLNSDELMSSKAVAISFSNKIHPALSYVVTAGVCLSLIGSLNVGFLTAGRMPYVAGRLGFMPDILSMVHVSFVSPMPALLFSVMLIAVMMIPSSVEILLEAVVFVLWSFRTLWVLGVLILRRTQSTLPRPYKVYTLTAVVSTIVVSYITIIPLVYQPQALYLLAVFLAVVFLVIYRLQLAQYISLTGIGKTTITLQKLLLVASPDE